MQELNPIYRRILVATDFSTHARGALHWAIWLARQSPASITLAHVLPDLRRTFQAALTRNPLDYFFGEGDQFQREVRRASDEKMRSWVGSLQPKDLTIQVETLLGEPFVELIHAVQAEGHDLVVAGTRGGSAWHQFLVGSTARRLIQKCPASVLVVREKHLPPPRVVMALTDFSPVSFKAVTQGYGIARWADAQFHVLHVLNQTADWGWRPSSKVAATQFAGETATALDLDAVRDRLHTDLQSLSLDLSNVQVHVVPGIIPADVSKVAQQLAVDLLALGTVGWSRIQGLFLGNTAEKVLHACDCSLLTVKPDGFVSPILPATWSLHPESS